MFCINCGRQKPQDAMFCPFCGAKNPAGNDHDNAEVSAQESSPAESAQAQWAREVLHPVIDVATPPVIQPTAQANTNGSVVIPKRAIWIAAGVGLVLVGFLMGLLVGGGGGDGKDDGREAINSPSATSVSRSAAEEDSDDLRGEAEGAEDFELPEVGEGESLYFGKGSIKDAGDFRVAFVLSEDGNKIHDVTLFAKGLNLNINQGGINARLSNAGIREHYSAVYPVGRVSTDIDLGQSKIYDLVIDGDTAWAEVDYVYTYREMSGARRNVNIPLGLTDVEFEVVDPSGDAGEGSGRGQAATQTPKPKAPSSGTVYWDNNSYKVTMGEFGETDDGKLTVRIQSPGIGDVLPFRNNKIVIPLQCAVVCNGKTTEWNRVTTNSDALIFEFDTRDTPQKVIVYPYGSGYNGAGSVTFDAVSGGVMD